jgi:hypothetical protein
MTSSSVVVSKSVLKTVSLFGRIGGGTVRLTPSGAPVTVTASSFEVGGRVTIVTASGETLSGTLMGVVSARFCNPAPNPRADGVCTGLAIAVEF